VQHHRVAVEQTAQRVAASLRLHHRRPVQGTHKLHPALLDAVAGGSTRLRAGPWGWTRDPGAGAAVRAGPTTSPALRPPLVRVRQGHRGVVVSVRHHERVHFVELHLLLLQLAVVGGGGLAHVRALALVLHHELEGHRPVLDLHRDRVLRRALEVQARMGGSAMGWAAGGRHVRVRAEVATVAVVLVVVLTVGARGHVLHPLLQLAVPAAEGAPLLPLGEPRSCDNVCDAAASTCTDSCRFLNDPDGNPARSSALRSALPLRLMSTAYTSTKSCTYSRTFSWRCLAPSPGPTRASQACRPPPSPQPPPFGGRRRGWPRPAAARSATWPTRSRRSCAAQHLAQLRGGRGRASP